MRWWAALTTVWLAAATAVSAMDVEPRSDGVAGITAATPFDLVTLIRLFPEHHVEAGTETAEGMEYPVIRVTPRVPPGARPALTVVGHIGSGSREIFSVLVHHAPSIGLPFAEFYPNGMPEDCLPGIEEHAGTVFCPATYAANVHVRFSGDWNGPDGHLPPLAAIAGWIADLLVWRPPATALSESEIAARLVGLWRCRDWCTDEGMAFHQDRGGRRFDSWRQNRFSIVDGAWTVDGTTLVLDCCAGAVDRWALRWSVRAIDDRRVVMQAPDAAGATILERLEE